MRRTTDRENAASNAASDRPSLSSDAITVWPRAASASRAPATTKHSPPASPRNGSSTQITGGPWTAATATRATTASARDAAPRAKRWPFAAAARCRAASSSPSARAIVAPRSRASAASAPNLNAAAKATASAGDSDPSTRPPPPPPNSDRASPSPPGGASAKTQSRLASWCGWPPNATRPEK